MILSGTLFRRLAAVIFTVLAGVFSTSAGSLTLQWDPSPDTTVAGYRVYWIDAATKTVNSLDVGNATTATVDSLDESKTYQFYVTAYAAIFNGLGFEQVESDPSNQVAYYLQGASGPFALQFGGFANATAQHSPHGTMDLPGEMYETGTAVSLFASPAPGYVCTGWTINSTFFANNPIMVTMNQNTVAAPVIQKASGSTVQNPPTEISLRMTISAGVPTVWVGGELGAWSLEGSANLTTWTEVATGSTSDQLSLAPAGRYAFYRVRPLTLQTFEVTAWAPRFTVSSN
jgi:hypothetical protein